MKPFLWCLFACLFFSCRKDVEISFDNYIEVNQEQFLRWVDSKGKYQSDRHPPYYEAVRWGDGNANAAIEVTVGNTCTNNRGALSDFHGFVHYSRRNGKDSVQYYGKFPLFQVLTSGNKSSISFNKLKIYRCDIYKIPADSADFVTVSGRVTFK
jgi:hypothetical protein